MANKPPKAYQALRELVEQHGGTMTFTRAGRIWGTWTVCYGGKERTFVSNGRGYVELDSLHVPKVSNPQYHADYWPALIPDAREKLLRLLDDQATDDDSGKVMNGRGEYPARNQKVSADTTRRKSMTTKKKKPEQTAERIYNIGKMTAGRDIIQGDQYNYQAVHTPDEFRQALEQLKTQIAELKKTPELKAAVKTNIELAETRLHEAVAEAGKERPLGERIKATLSEARDYMNLITGSLQSAAALGTTMGGLALMAINVFGG